MAEEIFTASTENLRDLKKQRKRICALVNRAIREKQDPDLISLTKMYALLYSAYVETSFLKLIHTPKAFTESEIIQIMAERNLEQKWLKCVDLAFNKLNTTNLGEVRNKGFELSLNSVNIDHKNFRWSSSFIASPSIRSRL